MAALWRNVTRPPRGRRPVDRPGARALGLRRPQRSGPGAPGPALPRRMGGRRRGGGRVDQRAAAGDRAGGDRPAARTRDDAARRPCGRDRQLGDHRPLRCRHQHPWSPTMTVTQPSLEGIDLLASTWGRGEPHDQFDRLRAEAPVHFHPESDGPGFWALTKHADVRAVSHDSETFSSEVGGTFIPTADEQALASLRLTILNMDPPKHNRYRRLVSKGFTPRMITSLVEEIERRAAVVDRRRVREGRDRVRRGDRRPGPRPDDLRDDRPGARGVAADVRALEPRHRVARRPRLQGDLRGLGDGRRWRSSCCATRWPRTVGRTPATTS